MEWPWDPEKNYENRRQHRSSFEMARLVFDDPLYVSIEDPYETSPGRAPLARLIRSWFWWLTPDRRSAWLAQAAGANHQRQESHRP